MFAITRIVIEPAINRPVNTIKCPKEVSSCRYAIVN